MVPIYGNTLVDQRVFVLGGGQDVLDGVVTFDMGLDAISTTDLDAFTDTLCVGYDNVTLSFYFIGKFNLPHIWDRVLLNTPHLNLKRQVNNNIT